MAIQQAVCLIVFMFIIFTVANLMINSGYGLSSEYFKAFFLTTVVITLLGIVAIGILGVAFVVILTEFLKFIFKAG
jgi:hypothetical protein